MVAETVGVPVSDVHVISTQDTDVTPFDPGAFASRQSYVAAPALRSAALLLKEKIIAHAAVMLHQSAMNLTLIKGHIVLIERPEEPLMSLKDLAMDAFTTLNAAGSFFPPKAPSKPPLTHRRLAVPLLI